MATTITAPNSHAQIEPIAGFSYVFAEAEIREAIADRFNAMQLGVVPLVGDLAGTGSDTLRITHIDGVGYDAEFQDLASETDTVTPSNMALGYSEVTIALGGLGYSETYQQQLLNRQPGISLDDIKAKTPEAWIRTWRKKVCVAGQGISTAVGSASRALNVDDYLDLLVVFEEAADGKAPTLWLARQQRTQLKEAFRVEPAYQAEIAAFDRVARFDGAEVITDFMGSGITMAVTSDVQQSGGAYQGFAHAAGGIGWARVNTGGLKTANPGGTMLVPEYGLVIEEVPGSGAQGQRKFEGRTWYGVALGSTDVYTLRRLISLV